MLLRFHDDAIAHRHGDGLDKEGDEVRPILVLVDAVVPANAIYVISSRRLVVPYTVW